MAKKKVPFKYRPKQIMERQLKDRKPPSAPSKRKVDWKLLFKRLPGRIAKFFRDVVHELKRVSWPSRKSLITYTIVVLVTLVFFATILGLFDFAFLRLIAVLAKI